MSLFEKCEVYLNNYNIELQDSDYTPDGRCLIYSDGDIRRWDFNIPQPSKEDLDKIEPKDIEKVKKRKQKRDKLKRITSQFPVLSQEELLDLKPFDGLMYINESDGSLYYYYRNRLQKVRVFDNV